MRYCGRMGRKGDETQRLLIERARECKRVREKAKERDEILEPSTTNLVPWSARGKYKKIADFANGPDKVLMLREVTGMLCYDCEDDFASLKTRRL